MIHHYWQKERDDNRAANFEKSCRKNISIETYKVHARFQSEKQEDKKIHQEKEDASFQNWSHPQKAEISLEHHRSLRDRCSIATKKHDPTSKNTQSKTWSETLTQMKKKTCKIIELCDKVKPSRAKIKIKMRKTMDETLEIRKIQSI